MPVVRRAGVGSAAKAEPMTRPDVQAKRSRVRRSVTREQMEARDYSPYTARRRITELLEQDVRLAMSIAALKASRRDIASELPFLRKIAKCDAPMKAGGRGSE